MLYNCVCYACKIRPCCSSVTCLRVYLFMCWKICCVLVLNDGFMFNGQYVPVAHGAVLHLWSVGSLRWSTVARDTGETHLHASKMALRVAPVVDQVGTPEPCGHNQRWLCCFSDGWRPKNLRINSSSLLGSSFPRNPLTFQNRGIPGNTVLGGGAYRQLQVHVHKCQIVDL